MQDIVRVLVVEDSPLMRRLLVEALARRPGFHVEQAENGLEALKKIADTQFDLVITDVNMPVMDGLKLIHRLRSDARYAKTPIAVISTEGSNEDRQRAIRLGANAYLTKPITAADVATCVDALLSSEATRV